MKTKNLLFILVLLLHAGLTHAQTSPDDCWGYVNTLQDEWLRKICTMGLDTVYIVGENGLIARSTDRGETWDKQYIGTAHLNGVKFIDPRTGFAVGEGGAMLKTTDAGETWTQQTSGTTENINALAFTDLNNLWAVGAKSLVLHSTDGGVTWQKKNIVDVECTLNDIAFRESLGYFVGDYGVVYKTEDGGKDWIKEQAFETSEILNSLSMTENKTYLVSLQQRRAFVSDNQGNWESIDEDEGASYGVCFLNDNVGYLVCYAIAVHEVISIHKTINGGKDWGFENFKRYPIGEISSYYTHIQMVNEQLGYVISGKTLSKKPAPIYDTVKLGEDKNTDSVIVLLSDKNMIIKSDMLTISSCELINLEGQILKTNKFNANYECQIDISDLSQGIYFVNLVLSDNSQVSKKIIKQ